MYNKDPKKVNAIGESDRQTHSGTLGSKQSEQDISQESDLSPAEKQFGKNVIEHIQDIHFDPTSHIRIEEQGSSPTSKLEPGDIGYIPNPPRGTPLGRERE